MRRCFREKCGKEFEPKKPQAKFCSDTCRVYHSREIKRKTILKNLGDDFDTTIKLNEGTTETDILKKIIQIERETIPKERDTAMGRVIWQSEKNKRINELKNKIL